MKWYFETTDKNWWDCDAEGALCTLKTGFTIDTTGAPAEVAPPNTPEQAPPGTPTEADPSTISPGDPNAPGSRTGAKTPIISPNRMERQQTNSQST